jgi:hypothetical protein
MFISLGVNGKSEFLNNIQALSIDFRDLFSISAYLNVGQFRGKVT